MADKKETVKVELTPEELAEHQATQAQALVDKEAREAAQAVVDAKKASGKQKLKDLGLDDAEISALTGA